jgi:nitrogen-specific signal transduction histidine kinase
MASMHPSSQFLCVVALNWNCVEPETLEVAADADLLDQAVFNLVRNSVEALRDATAGHISLSAN